MNEPMTMKVRKLHPHARLPQYATDGAACFDLHACFPLCDHGARAAGLIVSPHFPQTLGTGLCFEVPPGYALLIFSRSGHGFKHGTRLANCVGVIDSDYRGEVKVRLTADPGGELLVNDGDRIAQAVLVPIPRVSLVEVDELSKTARGAGGFGSTGA